MSLSIPQTNKVSWKGIAFTPYHERDQSTDGCNPTRGLQGLGSGCKHPDFDFLSELGKEVSNGVPVVERRAKLPSLTTFLTFTLRELVIWRTYQTQCLPILADITPQDKVLLVPSSRIKIS